MWNSLRPIVCLTAAMLVLALAPAAPASAQWSGYYRITARHSGKAMVVQSASTANSANVFQWTYGGTTTNDEWELRDIGSGYHRLINRHSGKDLTVQSASTADGANIFQYTYGGTTTNDEWALVDVGGGYHRITNRHSGKSAEVAGAGTADGTNVAQRAYSGGLHQQWQITSLSGSSTPTATPTPTPSGGTPTATPTPTPTAPPAPGCARTVNVSSSSSLSSAAANALAGDCIIVANGSYAGFSTGRDGTSSAPIVIRAANRGGATINSGVIRLQGANWITIEGFVITTSGAAISVDGGTQKAAVSFESSNDCRLTRCTLRLSGHTGSTEWVLLNGNSNRNRIDHNEFGPNDVDGHLIWPRGNPTIAGVTPPADRTSWANGNGPHNPNMARHTRIDHNYFHDHLPSVTNGGESIVPGGIGMTGDYQDTFTTIENNLWVNVFGDGEIISCKTSSTTIRYNTFRSCGGGPVSRAGNKTKMYGNFILGGNRTGSSGIRIHEMDHEIYNNYIERVQGVPMWIGNGDPYCCGTFSHAIVKRAKVVYNTLVNNADVFRIGNSHPEPPQNIVVANNLLSGTNFSGPQPMSGWVYSQNIVWPNNPGRTGWVFANPGLSLGTGSLMRPGASSPAANAANASVFANPTDMDGQARSTPDIGADEVSSALITNRPLTTGDVGPNAP